MLHKRSHNQTVGEQEESTWSIELHTKYKGVPLLVSEKLLRSLGMGQIDLATVFPDLVLIWEVKKDKDYLSIKQWKRLQLSQEYLAKIFQRPTKLKVVSPD